MKSVILYFVFPHLSIFSHLHRCLLQLFPRRSVKFSLDTLAGNISLYCEKGVLVTLDGVSVHVYGVGGSGGPH